MGRTNQTVSVQGATIGRVQQNKKEVDCDFVIAMLQSLSLKEYSFGDFDSVGTLIVDEAHHICAKVFSQSLFKMCPKHIFGLSATPNRKDGLTKGASLVYGSYIFCRGTRKSTAGRSVSHRV
jgi:superfamily II DNA or RNA helicase